MTRPSIFLSVAIVAALAFGCNSNKDVAARKDSVVTVAPRARPDCPLTGLWKNCEIMEHLGRMGISPHEEPTDTTRVSFLTPPGVHFRIGKTSRLIAFFYKDSIAAKKVWASLDTIRLSPKGDTTSYWGGTTFKPIRSGNLIAAFVSESDRTTERVFLSLMAGLPAPGK